MDFAKECKQERKMMKGIRMISNRSLGGTIFDKKIRFYEPKMSWFLMIKLAQFLLTKTGLLPPSSGILGLQLL